MDESTVTDEGKKSILKQRNRFPLQEVQSFYPDDDVTVTTTMTKNRRVSFGRNLVKGFIVGSAASTQGVYEYELSSESLSDPSECSGPLDLAVNKSTVIEPQAVASAPLDCSTSRPPEERARIFTENCISIAKSVFQDAETDFTAIIIGSKPSTADSSCMSFSNLDISNRFDPNLVAEQRANQFDFVQMSHKELPYTQIEPSQQVDKARFDFLDRSILHTAQSIGPVKLNRPSIRTPLSTLPVAHSWEDEDDENIPPAHSGLSRNAPTPTRVLLQDNTMEFTCANPREAPFVLNASTHRRIDYASDMEETCGQPLLKQRNSSISIWDASLNDDEDPLLMDGTRDDFLSDLSGLEGDNDNNTENVSLRVFQKDLANLSVVNQSFRQQLPLLNSTSNLCEPGNPVSERGRGNESALDCPDDMTGKSAPMAHVTYNDADEMEITANMDCVNPLSLGDDTEADPFGNPCLVNSTLSISLEESECGDDNPKDVLPDDGMEFTQCNRSLISAAPKNNGLDQTQPVASVEDEEDPLLLPSQEGSSFLCSQESGVKGTNSNDDMEFTHCVRLVGEPSLDTVPDIEQESDKLAKNAVSQTYCHEVNIEENDVDPFPLQSQEKGSSFLCSQESDGNEKYTTDDVDMEFTHCDRLVCESSPDTLPNAPEIIQASEKLAKNVVSQTYCHDEVNIEEKDVDPFPLKSQEKGSSFLCSQESDGNEKCTTDDVDMEFTQDVRLVRENNAKEQTEVSNVEVAEPSQIGEETVNKIQGESSFRSDDLVGERATDLQCEKDISPNTNDAKEITQSVDGDENDEDPFPMQSQEKGSGFLSSQESNKSDGTADDVEMEFTQGVRLVRENNAEELADDVEVAEPLQMGKETDYGLNEIPRESSSIEGKHAIDLQECQQGMSPNTNDAMEITQDVPLVTENNMEKQAEVPLVEVAEPLELEEKTADEVRGAPSFIEGDLIEEHATDLQPEECISANTNDMEFTQGVQLEKENNATEQPEILQLEVAEPLEIEEKTWRETGIIDNDLVGECATDLLSQEGMSSAMDFTQGVCQGREIRGGLTESDTSQVSVVEETESEEKSEVSENPSHESNENATDNLESKKKKESFINAPELHSAEVEEEMDVTVAAEEEEADLPHSLTCNDGREMEMTIPGLHNDISSQKSDGEEIPNGPSLSVQDSPFQGDPASISGVSNILEPSCEVSTKEITTTCHDEIFLAVPGESPRLPNENGTNATSVGCAHEAENKCPEDGVPGKAPVPETTFTNQATSALPLNTPLAGLAALATRPSLRDKLQVAQPDSTMASTCMESINMEEAMRSMEITRSALVKTMSEEQHMRVICESTRIMETEEATYTLQKMDQIAEATYTLPKHTKIESIFKRSHSDSPLPGEKSKKRASASPRILNLTHAVERDFANDKTYEVQSAPTSNSSMVQGEELGGDENIADGQHKVISNYVANKRSPTDSPLPSQRTAKRNRISNSPLLSRNSLCSNDGDVSYSGPSLCPRGLDTSLALLDDTLSSPVVPIMCRRDEQEQSLRVEIPVMTPRKSTIFAGEKSLYGLDTSKFVDANNYSITVPQLTGLEEIHEISHVTSPHHELSMASPPACCPLPRRVSTRPIDEDIQENNCHLACQRVEHELTSQALEENCIWRLQGYQNCTNGEGAINVKIGLLNTALVLKATFKHQGSSCFMAEWKTEEVQPEKFLWPQDLLVNSFGVQALNNYVENEFGKLEKLDQLPIYLDYFNAYARKITSLMEDLLVVVKGCASAELSGSKLSLRLYTFIPLSSCYVIIDLMDILHRGRPSITFRHDMGRMNENPLKVLRSTVQQPILQNLVKSFINHTVEEEEKTGFVTRRPKLLF